MLKFSAQNNNDSYAVSLSDLLFPEFPASVKTGFARQAESAAPKINIKENDDAFLLELAVPGRKKEDFNIVLDQALLTISAGSQEESASEEKHYQKREFFNRQFSKVFELPESADTEKVSAQYLQGVLSIRVPKREELKPQPPRDIPVK